LKAQAISRSLCLCLAQQFVRNIQSGSHGRNLGVFFVVGKLKHRRGEGVRAKIKNAGRGCPAWRGWRVVTIRLFAKRRIVIAGLVIRWGRSGGAKLVCGLGAEEAAVGHQVLILAGCCHCLASVGKCGRLCATVCAL
jgi:hypothetical protein